MYHCVPHEIILAMALIPLYCQHIGPPLNHEYMEVFECEQTHPATS